MYIKSKCCNLTLQHSIWCDTLQFTHMMHLQLSKAAPSDILKYWETLIKPLGGIGSFTPRVDHPIQKNTLLSYTLLMMLQLHEWRLG